jgi:hypothetical protein
MTTKVGRYLVSTVGDYRPRGSEEAEELGYQRLYETMVFKAGKPCQEEGCGCGLPSIDGTEIDMEGYKTAAEAQKGHMAMCRKYDRIATKPKPKAVR